MDVKPIRLINRTFSSVLFYLVGTHAEKENSNI